MSVLLALGAALSYGVSDFIGGIASRRTSVWPIAFTACLGAALGTLVLALLVPGHPTGADFTWGVLGGIGSGLGTAFLYRGFARGRMGVVGPVSAVGAALLPATLAIATGERPSVLVLVGMLVALPSIWLVSREPADVPEAAVPDRVVRAPGAPGLTDGLLAGLGFGLLFATIGQVPEGAGYWPVLGAQLVSLVAVAGVAVALGGSPLPHRGADWWGLAAGGCATVAVVGFMLARQQGLLSVAAVLTSLYPAVTVLLAALVLREGVHRTQGVGLALCAVSVTLVALG